jgi:medium-chain acyl-[acyl-carrier-protein] hydrolase
MLCFSYAGGGASVYRTWPASLPPAVEICAIQLPGRESRLVEEPYDELAPVVRALAEALSPLLETRFVCFGHSLGGLVAFELARLLRRSALPQPDHLIVSGCVAPHLPDPEPPIHALPHDEFVRALRRFEGTPRAVLENEELIELILPGLRADFALTERYVYEPDAPLDVPITSFYGDADTAVTEAEAAAWRRETTREFALRRLPGGHFFLRTAQEELLAAVAATLAPLLHAAAASESVP